MHGSLVQQSEDCQLDGLCATCHRPIVAIYPLIANPWYIGASIDSRSGDGRAGSRRLGHSWMRLRTLVRRGRQAQGGLGRRRSRPPVKKARDRARGPAKKARTASRVEATQNGKPKKVRTSGARSVGCCSTCSGRAGRRARGRRRVRLPLPDDRHPGPERGLRDPDVVRLLRRRQDRARPASPPRTATSIPYDEMPQDVKDAVVAAENRTLLDRQRHRPQGHRPRGVQQRHGQRHPGRVDDHPAVRQDPLPHPGALLHAQAEGGDPLAQAAAQESASSEILEGYLNTIYFGRGAYGIQAAAQAYFDKDATDLDLRESAGAGQRSSTTRRSFDPANGKDAEAGAARALPLRARRHGRDGQHHRGRGRRRPAKRLPKFPTRSGRRQVRRPEGPRADHGEERAHHADQRRDRTAVHRRRRSTAAACGSPRRSPRRRWTRPRRASTRSARRARSSATRTCTSAWPASRSTPARCAASTPARTTSTAQINWAIAGRPGRLVVQAVRAGGRAQGRLLAQGHLRRQLALRARRRHRRSATRATTTTAPRSTCSRPPRTRSTPPSPTSPSSMPDGPAEDPRDDERDGHPAGQGAAGKRLRLPATHSAGLEPVPGITLGSATISPINMANGYATIANGGRFHAPYIIEKVESQGRRGPLRPLGERRAGHRPGAGLGHRRRRQLRAAAGRRRPAPARRPSGSTDRPPARPAPRPTTSDQVDSSWFIGYTPQLATSVMYVRGKGNEQLDGWLPSYFGGDYPADTWTDDHEARHGRRRRRGGLPAAGVRRRRGARRRPRSRPCRPRRPRSRRRPRRRPRPAKPTKTPTAVPTPTPTPTHRAYRPPPTRRPRRRPTRRPRDRPATSSAARRRRRRATATPPQPSAGRMALAPWPGGTGCAGDVTARPTTRPATSTRPSTTRSSPPSARESADRSGPARAGHPWWTPTRVLLLLAAVVFALGMVQKSGCYDAPLGLRRAPLHAHVLLRPALPLHRARAGRAGLALLRRPAGAGPLRGDGVPRRHLLLRVRRRVGDALGRPARRTSMRGATSRPATWSAPTRCRRSCASSSSSTRSASPRWRCCRRGCWPGSIRGGRGTRPPSPLSPALLLTGLVNWDMLAVVFVAGALWTWARGRPVATGRADRARHGDQALPAVPARPDRS